VLFELHFFSHRNVRLSFLANPPPTWCGRRGLGLGSLSVIVIQILFLVVQVGVFLFVLFGVVVLVKQE